MNNPSKNSNAKAATAACRQIAELRPLIATLATKSTKVLVVGPVAAVGNPTTGQPALVAIQAYCGLAHLNALRGVDHWKDFDIVVAVGRNEPPVPATDGLLRGDELRSVAVAHGSRPVLYAPINTPP